MSADMDLRAEVMCYKLPKVARARELGPRG